MPDKPLLIISDAISGTSGLARIARDLSTRIHEHLSDVYRVGTAGYGAAGSRKFGDIPQYHLKMDDWVCLNLPEIVEDFAGDERCIVCFIWDLHRLTWFSQPERLGGESLAKYPGLQEWLKSANIERWLYCPIDSSGPQDRLSFPIALTALGFDRLLAYGPFGESVLRASIGDEEANKRHLKWLPHGYDGDNFYPLPRKLPRRLFLEYTQAKSLLNMLGVEPETRPIQDDEVLISICATNQARKCWPLALESCAILSKNHRIRVWIHVDALERNFSIPSLLVDYSLLQNSVISLGYITDQKLASALCASDLCIMAGPEGFGLVGLESLAVSTPVITGGYAGAADFIPREMQIDPLGFYEEGSYGSRRPVYRAEHLAAKAEEWIGKRASIDPRYDWSNLWPNEWEPWFRSATGGI